MHPSKKESGKRRHSDSLGPDGPPWKKNRTHQAGTGLSKKGDVATSAWADRHNAESIHTQDELGAVRFILALCVSNFIVYLFIYANTTRDL